MDDEDTILLSSCSYPDIYLQIKIAKNPEKKRKIWMEAMAQEKACQVFTAKES